MSTVLGSAVTLPSLQDPTVVIVGYAGRDEAAVQAHIDELAAFGVAPPPRVPMLYPVPSSALTISSTVPVSGLRTSGEVEPVLVRASGAWFLALGSDHTDREAEKDDVLTSKLRCPKPISSMALPIGGDPAAGSLDAEWDHLTIRSEVGGRAYQDGMLSELRFPSDVIARAVQDDNGDVVIFGGTVPTLEGAFRFDRSFSATLIDGDDVLLSLQYEAEETN